MARTIATQQGQLASQKVMVSFYTIVKRTGYDIIRAHVGKEVLFTARVENDIVLPMYSCICATTHV